MAQMSRFFKPHKFALESSLALAEPLFLEEVPRVANCLAKVLTLLPLIIGVGSAILLSKDHVNTTLHNCTIAMAGKYVQPVNAQKSAQPAVAGHFTRSAALTKQRHAAQIYRKLLFDRDSELMPRPRDRQVPAAKDDRFNGIITYWNVAKAFGFIRPDDDSDDVFLHFRDISTDSVKRDGEHPSAGDSATFSKIFLPGRDTRSYRAVDAEVTPNYGKGRMLEWSNERLRGTMRYWNDKKGFGFIEPFDGTYDLFFHSNDIQTEYIKRGGRQPQAGDMVSYIRNYDYAHQRYSASQVDVTPSLEFGNYDAQGYGQFGGNIMNLKRQYPGSYRAEMLALVEKERLQRLQRSGFTADGKPVEKKFGSVVLKEFQKKKKPSSYDHSDDLVVWPRPGLKTGPRPGSGKPWSTGFEN